MAATIEFSDLGIVEPERIKCYKIQELSDPNAAFTANAVWLDDR
jgi:hypothetical protein